MKDTNGYENRFITLQKEIYIKFYKFLVNLTPEDRKMGLFNHLMMSSNDQWLYDSSFMIH